MGRKYEDVSQQHDADGWVAPVQNGYRLSCCDCGLVHAFDFRVGQDGNVEYRIRRDNRATAQVRRAIPYTLIGKFPHLAARTLRELYARVPEELDGFIARLRKHVENDVSTRK